MAVDLSFQIGSQLNDSHFEFCFFLRFSFVRMAVNHLLVLLIFLLAFKTGFSAEISVFVKTGDSVQLDIQTQELTKINVLFWGKNDTTQIVTYAMKQVVKDSSYKDRVDFNAETFSLTLKNMQKTDSGLYTAKYSESIAVTYRVTVIDAVDAPVLTVNSNWSSSDSCTVNFTCRAHDLMINSRYQNNRCSPQEVTSHENYNIIMHCSDESIICNHSNPVSSKNDRIEIKQHCNKETVTRYYHTTTNLLPIIACIVMVVLVPVLCLALFIYRRYKGAQEADNTVYAQVEVQDQTQEETGDNRPNTTYCTVGQHQKPAVSIETDHTIYSAVCKLPNKKPPSISSDDT